MSNVISFTAGTYGPVPVQNVLEGALEADLKEVMVIGLDEMDGLYVACSTGDKPDLLYLLERARIRAMSDIEE